MSAFFIIVTLLLMHSQAVEAESPLLPPKLPDDPLHINVEATIYRTDEATGDLSEYTAYFEEYRDAVNNRGLAITVTNSTETRYYYDLNAKQGFSVVRKLSVPLEQAECTTTNLTLKEGMFGAFAFTEGADGGLIISNVSSFFQWSKDKKPSFQGYGMARGINASLWLILDSEKAPYNLTYYFSEGHTMPYYYNYPVPLRIEMKGSSTSSTRGSASFYHVYDFNLVAPMGPKDDTFFATPRGVHCPMRNVPNGSERKFADQYIISEQIIVEAAATVDFMTAYFDYNLNMTRSDYEFTDGEGYSRVKVIHDFTHNYQMLVNKDTGTCTVTRIPAAGPISWDVATDDGENVRLMHTKSQRKNILSTYQGKRIENGIPVDVWCMKEVASNGTVTVQETWYTHPSWKVRAAQTVSTSYSVYAGSSILVYDKNTHKVLSRVTLNAFNQYYGPLQVDSGITADVFDAPECYDLDSFTTEHLNFLVEDVESWYANRKLSKNGISRAVKGHMAKLGVISPTRIVNVEVYENQRSSTKVLKIYFVFRAKLTLTGAPLHEEAESKEEIAIATAFMNGKMQTKDGLLMPVTLLDGHTGDLIIASKLRNDEGTVEDTLKDKSPPKTYSSAAMAGLGLGMLILGAIITVGAGGILWIKRFDLNIPYLTQSNE